MRIPDDGAWRIHQNRLRRLAREGARYTVQHIHRFRPEKRHALLVTFLIHSKQEITDQALDMHDLLIGRLFNRSEHRQQERLQQNTRSIHENLRLYTEVGKALLNAYKAKRDLTQALESVVTWDQLAESVNKTEELLGPDDSGHLQQMRSMYPQYRQYSPTLLKAFDFKGAPSSQPLLKAIDLLRILDEGGKRKVPANAPRGFVRPKWQPHVFPPDTGIDRCYYELCVLTELRNGLRSGDVWVEGSPTLCRFRGLPASKRCLGAPFVRRLPAEREAVIAAMLLVLRGAETDRVLGVRGVGRARTAEFRPFVEILCAVKGKEKALWQHVRTWPGGIQDRASGALRYLESERADLSRASKSSSSRSAGRVGSVRW